MATLDCEKVNLKKGAKGADVTTLQTLLKSMGYYTRSIDGDFGVYTQNAVKAFQKANGLTVDGWFGKITCQKLNAKQTAKENAAKAVASTFDCPNMDLRKGSKGDQVKTLQTMLKELGYYTRQIDGDFGDYTKKAVQAYQKSQGLLQDGIFGPQTCAKMKITAGDVAKDKEDKNATPEKVVYKDPYKVNTKNNVFTASESNLSIDGIYFQVSGVTFTSDFNNRPWKRIDLMNGGQYSYLGYPSAREYSVDVIMSKAMYDTLKWELYKMQHRPCKVTSTLLDSATYTVEVSVAYQNVGSRKVTLKLTEYLS